SVLLKICINSYLTLTEQKIVLLGMQDLYLQANPQHETMKEHAYFLLYEKLTAFHFIRPILKDVIDPLMEQLRYATATAKWLFIAVVLLFLFNYFLFVYSAW